MRITGGKARSRRLSAPRGHQTRPTAERVREALFSILGPPPPEALVLDLFAGAGTLGLEALSRGAHRAVFVDRSRMAVRFIRDNVGALNMAEASEIHCAVAEQLLPRLVGPFHWVFVDPPYASDLAVRVLEQLGERPAALTRGATVVVEHDRRSQPDPAYGCLVQADSRRYGDTGISLYTPRVASDEEP